MTLKPICRNCAHPMSVPDRPQGGGRTKIYCGTRCRVEAYRLRKWTIHGSLGTEPANRLPD
jgi:hypothetical protein